MISSAPDHQSYWRGANVVSLHRLAATTLPPRSAPRAQTSAKRSARSLLPANLAARRASSRPVLTRIFRSTPWACAIIATINTAGAPRPPTASTQASVPSTQRASASPATSTTTTSSAGEKRSWRRSRQSAWPQLFWLPKIRVQAQTLLKKRRKRV